jgi:probable HAF family extracellular repeat protein
MVFALAAVVIQLTLPPSWTVDPSADARAIVMLPDHSVVALAHDADPAHRPVAIRWHQNGTRERFAAAPITGVQRDNGYPLESRAIAFIDGVPVVTVVNAFSGAYSGENVELQRWTAHGGERLTLPDCTGSYPQTRSAVGLEGSERYAYTYAVDPPNYAVDNPRGPQSTIVNGATCTDLGAGIVNDLHGDWAAGWLYAPHEATSDAIRWHGAQRQDLGPGSALAVNAAGIAVGKSMPAQLSPSARLRPQTGTTAGGHSYAHTTLEAVPPSTEPRLPQRSAVMWRADGSVVDLAPPWQQSTAYDVSADGTVVGVLLGADHRHYAFKWKHGVLTRLDDLPHPVGWRFESAYAIAADGTIAGIGTYRGIAAIFLLRD